MNEFYCSEYCASANANVWYGLQISGFLTEESPKSLIKPTVQERQPKKQQSSSLAKKQIRQAVPKKRRRSSVSRETPHTLMREILERGMRYFSIMCVSILSEIV